MCQVGRGPATDSGPSGAPSLKYSMWMHLACVTRVNPGEGFVPWWRLFSYLLEVGTQRRALGRNSHVLEAESCRSFVPQESFQINYLEIPNTGTPGGRILSCSRGRGHGQAEISGESLVGPFGSGGLSWEGLSESQAFQRSPRLGFPSRSLSACCSCSTRGRAHKWRVRAGRPNSADNSEPRS